jgi:hypothetical protein
MKNTPESDVQAPEADDVSPQQSARLRRSLLKAGLGASTVLMAKQSHSTITGKTYSCTISGHRSGNQSHPDFDKDKDCRVGLAPSKWCKFSEYPWPSGCNTPVIKKKNTYNNNYVSHSCGYKPSKTEFSQAKYCIHPTRSSSSSNGTSSCHPGSLFQDVLGTTQGTSGISCLTELGGSTTRKPSLFEILAYPESYSEFVACIAAAMLNAKKYPTTYPCSEKQVRDIWVAIRTSGTYQAVPGKDWSESEIIEYLKLTWT